MPKVGTMPTPEHMAAMREGFVRWLEARRGQPYVPDDEPDELPSPTDRWLRERFDHAVPVWRAMGTDEYLIEELMVAICVEIEVRRALYAMSAVVRTVGIQSETLGHLALITDKLLMDVPELGDPRELCDRLAVFIGIGLTRVYVAPDVPGASVVQ